MLVTGGIEPGEQMVITDLPAPVEGMSLRTTETRADRTAARGPALQEDPS